MYEGKKAQILEKLDTVEGHLLSSTPASSKRRLQQNDDLQSILQNLKDAFQHAQDDGDTDCMYKVTTCLIAPRSVTCP